MKKIAPAIILTLIIGLVIGYSLKKNIKSDGQGAATIVASRSSADAAASDLAGKIIAPPNSKVLKSIQVLNNTQKGTNITNVSVSALSTALINNGLPGYLEIWKGCNGSANMTYVFDGYNWYYWNGSTWAYSAFNGTLGHPACTSVSYA